MKVRLAALFTVAAALVILAYAIVLAPALQTSTPAYASVRTDPSGSSVLFGALEHEGLTVVRGFEPGDLASMPPAQTTAFVLAPEQWSNGLGPQLADFASRGGRLIIAAPPAPLPVVGNGLPPDPDAQSPGDALAYKLVNASGTDMANDLDRASPTADAPAGILPLELSQPQVWLQLGSHAWHRLYAAEGHVYAAWRPFGRGQAVVFSEATFASNLTLARQPDLALLDWLVGGRRQIWVDESAHGLAQSRGIAWLLRRYHLGPGLIVLLVGLVLLAWSVSGSLERPPLPPTTPQPELIPETAFQGYVRLLRRAHALDRKTP